ncbi:MAG: aldehyde dehydrogenase family protein [Pseudobdellovibrio sp.]
MRLLKKKKKNNQNMLSELNAQSSFRTVNPWNNQVLKEYNYARGSDIESSLNRLNNEFNRWKKLSYQQRQVRLNFLNNYFILNKDLIADSIRIEMGKPITQARSEVQKTIDAIDFLCRVKLDNLFEQHIQTRFNATFEHKVIYKPKGIIMGIMPWNFPLWQSIRMLLPTLISGNSVLLKSSELTPSVGDFISQAFQYAELNDVFAHHIFHHSFTETLIADERIQGISLTGSTQAGFKLSELAGRYMKKSVFELGGSDAYLVLADANLNLAAECIAASRLQNTGQSCIACKRVFVHEQVYSDFIKKLCLEFDEYKFGDLSNSETCLGPLSNVKFAEQEMDVFKVIEEHVEIIYLREPYSELKQFKDAHLSGFAPVRILRVKTDAPIEFYSFLNQTEFFSPTLIVMTYKDLDNCLKEINASHFGLGAAIFTHETRKALEIAQEIHTGMIAINDYIRSDYELPFGGVKKSGHGRELGLTGFVEFCDLQLIATALKQDHL